MQNRSELKVLLLAGLLAREIFSFWTGHPFDFELWVRLGYAMVHGGDPYGSLPPVPGLSFANLYSLRDSATIAYLPFWPLISGALYLAYSAMGVNNRFVYYFILKQPIIVGDVALGYLLYSYISSRKPNMSAWALRFWLFSPFTIILSGIWGMFDSLAMAFVLVSMISTRYLRTAFWAGIGTFAKSLPVIYTIPLSFKGKRGWWSIPVAIMIPVILSATTFVAMHWSLPHVTSALTFTVSRGGESMSAWDAIFYLNYLGVMPALDQRMSDILGILWIPALAALTAVAYIKFRFNNTEYGLVQSLLLVTLGFLIFKARVTEQYAIYLLAISTIDVALWNERRKPILTASTATVLIYLLSNNYFLVRFLSPIYPNSAQLEYFLYQLLGGIRLATNFIFGCIFTALNILYLLMILKASRLTPVDVASSLSDKSTSSEYVTATKTC